MNTESKNAQQHQSIKPNRTLSDPKERERVLMMYAGIFKRSIPEFASKILIKEKKKINHAK